MSGARTDRVPARWTEFGKVVRTAGTVPMSSTGRNFEQWNLQLRLRCVFDERIAYFL